MSSMLTTIREESESDGEESKGGGRSEADELENSFVGDTNMSRNEEDDNNSDEVGAGVMDEWIIAHSNTYAREHMGLYGKFGYQKWKNITALSWPHYPALTSQPHLLAYT
eukprot:1701683-Ditylum_brightwellii.AAC.1